MKLRTIIIGLFVTLFFVSNVYAIEQYRWGMTKAEAVIVLQKIMAKNGMGIKGRSSVNDMLILDAVQDGHIVGSSVLHFDKSGGLIGVGSLFYTKTEKRAMYVYRHTNIQIQSKTGMKLQSTSNRKAVYQDDTEKIVVFVTQDQSGMYVVGIATSKLGE